MAKPTPFNIAISDSDLKWITDRVKTTRLPAGKQLPPGQEWSFGLPVDVAWHLREFWIKEYKWRTVEARLNQELQMYTLLIPHGDEDLTIHFVHHISPATNAIPLLFIHGWPGSFLEVQPIINELTHPSSPTAQAYHVVAPSLPGYGFSSYPARRFEVGDHAAVLDKLMLALGYNTYIAQGGDWGSIISRVLAVDHKAHCVGIHINMIFALTHSLFSSPIALGRLIFGYLTGWWPGSSSVTTTRLKRMKWWMDDENGYREIQGTKPQTIAYPLVDSPFGMMCWMRDKLEHLVGEGFVWEDETVITWAMIYILNGTPGPSEIYKTTMDPEGKTKLIVALSKMITIPVGVSSFPKDPMYAPQWWAEASMTNKIVLWREHEDGGHFSSVEKPKQLAEDIREFTVNGSILDKVRAGKDKNV